MNTSILNLVPKKSVLFVYELDLAKIPKLYNEFVEEYLTGSLFWVKIVDTPQNRIKLDLHNIEYEEIEI